MRGNFHVRFGKGVRIILNGTLTLVRCGNSSMSCDNFTFVPSTANRSSGLGIGENSMLNLASQPKAISCGNPISATVARSFSYDETLTSQTIITTVLKPWESLVGNR